MLVLSRKIGEDIVIGDNIHITVVAIRGENVRLGISAPKEVVVDRQEVYEKRKNSLSEGPAPTSTTSLPEELLHIR
jgi:carbon storage regulator